MTIPGATFGSRYLCFQKGFVFVSGGAADIAHSRQFADVELAVFVGGIVAEKTCGDVLFAHLRPLSAHPEGEGVGIGAAHSSAPDAGFFLPDMVGIHPVRNSDPGLDSDQRHPCGRAPQT